MFARMPSPPDLPGVTHRYHDLSTGVRAHVAHAGPEDAPAVVLLHGFPQHWYCWRKVIAALGADHRLLAMDTRGLGWSGRPADDDYRKARIAEDAAALLDDLGLERALLAGHDWGGWAGWIAALDHPERWTGYVAAGIPHPWAPTGQIVRSAPRFLYQPPIALPRIGPQLIARWVVPAFIKGAWGDGEPDEVAAFADAYRDPARAESASRYYRDWLTKELPGAQKGKRLTIPTRLLYGTADPLGTRLTHGLERHGDDVATTFLAGCGHFVPEERPDEVAAAIRALS